MFIKQVYIQFHLYDLLSINFHYSGWFDLEQLQIFLHFII